MELRHWTLAPTGPAPAWPRDLRALARGQGVLQSLRTLLADEGSMDVCRLNDDQVVARVESLLGRRRLVLLEPASPAPSPARLDGAPTPAVEPPAALPAAVMGRPARVVAPAPVETAAAPRTTPDFAQVDQDMQAAILRAAARAAVPLCEVCERMARDALATA